MAVSTNALFSFAAGALLLAVGCREPEQAAVPSFVVNVASCHIDAPDTVRPGWSRMRVEEEGSPHVVVLFRMPDDVAASAISSFVAALDTSRMTPAGAIALGGPEVGQVGEIMHDLTPGEYLLACLMRGEDGHRHAMAGEVRVLHVRGERQALEPPTDAIALGMRDYIYDTDASWPSGVQTLHVANHGREDHQVRIDRLNAGMTLNDWLRAEENTTVGQPVTGVARMSPGQSAYLPVQLEPGTYVLYCLIPGADTGTLHGEMGMIRAVEVASASTGRAAGSR